VLRRLDGADPDKEYFEWKIDCWSVHISKEFRDWMKATHPCIVLMFVPGNCTGVFQPMDVGIQRVFKHSVKRSALTDLVKEVKEKVEEEREKGVPLRLSSAVGVLRDRSVSWLVDAYHAVNNPELCAKVSKNCRTLMTATHIHLGIQAVYYSQVQRRSLLC
jgi:hypothetical protein